MYIRALNALKNSKITNYDKAYPNYVEKKELDKRVGLSPEQLTQLMAEEFVSQVREAFFAMLRPFLCPIEEYINKKVPIEDAFFGTYFNTAEYLERYENMSEDYHKFA